MCRNVSALSASAATCCAGKEAETTINALTDVTQKRGNLNARIGNSCSGDVVVALAQLAGRRFVNWDVVTAARKDRYAKRVPRPALRGAKVDPIQALRSETSVIAGLP